jgi:type IV pilus assembly protein PilY1
MVGKPVIAQTGDYGSTSGPAWSVLIGNGYNSPKGTAALLQFDLATGKLYVHATDNTANNGLAAPLAWLNYPSSAISDVAYAGDLAGRVWSFTLIQKPTDGTAPTAYTPTPSSAGAKLFTATDASGTAQPITAGVWGASVPSAATLNPGSVWLFFGTGKYLAQDDVDSTGVQSWYGIMAQTSADSGPLTAYKRTDSTVKQRSIIGEQAASASNLALRAVTQPDPTTDPYSATDMAGKKAWVMDLESPSSSGTPNSVAQGERMVVPNQIQGSLLIGTTRIPKPVAEVLDPCNPAGNGWIMAVNPFSGTGPISNFFDANGDGQINGSDTITVNGQTYPAAGVGFTSLPNAPIFISGDMLVSFDNGATSNLKTGGGGSGTSRVSWQELITP